MGSLCSKESKSDEFAGAGRPLGSSAPAQASRASIPNRASKGKVTGQGRTLGSGTGETSGDRDKREAAAKAAEERANKSQTKGKLGQKLADQKKQTRTDTLDEASRESRLAREADQNKQLRNYN